jgi:uncharacterized membrane protein
MSTTDTSPAAPASEDRTVAILAYITIIGFIVAIVLHSSKKTALGAFHLRQVLGLILTAIGFGVCVAVLAFIPILGWLFIGCGWLALLALAVIGLINAASGQMKPVPVLGEKYQQWFPKAFD